MPPRRPASHRKPWTPEEISQLKRLSLDGMPMWAIAKQLGRTEAAVAATVTRTAMRVPRQVTLPDLPF